jgi:hypothetical protein
MTNRQWDTQMRRGISLLEAAVSIVVLGAALMTTAQILRWTALQERSTERRRCALEAATAVLDRFTLEPWEAITPSQAATLSLPRETAQSLGESRLIVKVAEEPGKPAAKRISVELGWGPTGRGAIDEVRLTTWVFQREAQK